jgi:hypothetical protein
MKRNSTRPPQGPPSAPSVYSTVTCTPYSTCSRPFVLSTDLGGALSGDGSRGAASVERLRGGRLARELHRHARGVAQPHPAAARVREDAAAGGSALGDRRPPVLRPRQGHRHPGLQAAADDAVQATGGGPHQVGVFRRQLGGPSRRHAKVRRFYRKPGGFARELLRA